MTCISKAVYAAVACCCLTGTISAQNIALKMNNVTVKQAMEELEKKNPNHFAVRQYKKYRLAAGDVCSK